MCLKCERKKKVFNVDADNFFSLRRFYINNHLEFIDPSLYIQKAAATAA